MAILENKNFSICISSVNKNHQFYSNKLICILKFVYDFSAVLTFLNSKCKPQRLFGKKTDNFHPNVLYNKMFDILQDLLRDFTSTYLC